jgi:hypothetical protein
MSGHGHVTPNEDGSKARCGGPGICGVCSRERAEKYPSALPIWPVRLIMPTSPEDPVILSDPNEPGADVKIPPASWKLLIARAKAGELDFYPDTSIAPDTPPSPEHPKYAKVRHQGGAPSSLFMIVCDEGWRQSIVATEMYGWAADWLIKGIGRRRYAPDHERG